jgi:hypothetical protein
LARAKNTLLPCAKLPIQAGLVGHFWRANYGNFTRVPKSRGYNQAAPINPL